MIRKRPITQLPNAVFQELGWDYFISQDAAGYLTSELVVVSEAEREAFYQAGNRLYEKFVAAAQHVLDSYQLDKLAIPYNLHEMIRLTWNDDRHLHLFGRFDFAGGVAGLPIKLLEFNADTPTSLPETAIIQWAQVKANDLPESAQFNFVYEALVDHFKRLRALNPDREPAILFSTMRGAPEDDDNTWVIQEAAREAGFETDFRYVDEVIFSEIEGVCIEERQAPIQLEPAHTILGGPAYNGDLGVTYRRFPFWFKLVPWEYIANDEPDLCDILTKIVRADLCVILNPAYTMLFQSKGILKYLWDLFPDEPLLLETTFEEPIGRYDFSFVQKVFFGREGSNVTVYDDIGLPLEVRGGDYDNQPSVFQARAELARDGDGQLYQAGVFFAYEACGLGFRRGPRLIIDNGAQFVGHVVE